MDRFHALYSKAGDMADIEATAYFMRGLRGINVYLVVLTVYVGTY